MATPWSQQDKLQQGGALHRMISTTQHSTAQHSPVQPSTAQHSAAQLSSIQLSSAQLGADWIDGRCGRAKHRSRCGEVEEHFSEPHNQDAGQEV